MRLLLTLLFFSSSILLSTSGHALTLKTEGACSDKTPLIVSELGFDFPDHHISSINVLNGDGASAVLTFVDNWLPLLHIITTDETVVSGGINERGGFQKLEVRNIVELFNKAKSDSTPSTYFTKVKKALALENPDNIHISASGKHHVILHQDAYENGADAIYIIRENDSRIMMLVADINSKQIETLLGYVCL